MLQFWKDCTIWDPSDPADKVMVVSSPEPASTAWTVAGPALFRSE
jgi:hypothetical protein